MATGPSAPAAVGPAQNSQERSASIRDTATGKGSQSGVSNVGCNPADLPACQEGQAGADSRVAGAHARPLRAMADRQRRQRHRPAQLRAAPLCCHCQASYAASLAELKRDGR